MEKIGSITNLSFTIAAQHNLTKLALQSREHGLVENIIQSLLTQLKTLAKSADFQTFLLTEEVILNSELANRANSPEETNSIKTALVQVADAKRSYQVVQDAKTYQEATKAFSTRQREAGLPIDGFREFIKSHTTRLTNRLSAPLPVSEKNLLRQRKENLKAAKESYIVLQRKAIDLSQSSDKDMEC